MRPITVDNQPWLSVSRIARITLDGIRYRLFRASVTIAVIMLAVAFMMNILAESLVKRRIAADCRQRLAQSQCIYKWIFRLENPGNRESFLREYSQCVPESDLYTECKAMSRLPDDALEALRQNAIRIVRLLDFFDSLDYAKRRHLLHGVTSMEFLRQLQNETALASFKKNLSTLKSLRFPLKDDELRQLLNSFDATIASTDAILECRRQAIENLAENLKNTPLIDALIDSEGEAGENIREAGFCFSPTSTAPLVAAQARQIQDILLVKKLLELRLHVQPSETPDVSLSIEQPFRQLLARRVDKMPADVTLPQLWAELKAPRFARQFSDTVCQVKARLESDSTIVPEGAAISDLDSIRLSPERLQELSQSQTENDRIVQAELQTADCTQGFLGLGERLCWLLAVSMLVCGIGIANAMMMSVTERFNEIATMKCLGALDGFIMVMFVLESCIMGVVGGIGGALLGTLIALLRLSFTFSPHILLSLPWADLLGGMAASILMGTLLSAVSAIIPSYKAAILAPMEAMRVE